MIQVLIEKEDTPALPMLCRHKDNRMIVLVQVLERYGEDHCIRGVVLFGGDSEKFKNGDYINQKLFSEFEKYQGIVKLKNA